MQKQVYISFSSDMVHHGHINVIKKGAELGEVTIGIVTDEVVLKNVGLPLLNFEQRKIILSSMKDVSKVIAQDTFDYEKNLRLLKPDYVVHGDDWVHGIQSHIRLRVIALLREWGGQLVEIPYTRDVGIDEFERGLSAINRMPEIRRKRLAQLLQTKKFVRVLEAHNGLTGIIAENTMITKGTQVKLFDAVWISSLCDSTSKGKPDIELVDMTSRLNTINEIMDVTTRPIILDGDSGGLKEHFVFNIKTLERIGVSAVVIEDKIGLKKNSLLKGEALQKQDSIQSFCEKISSGLAALSTDDFMIIARIESLVLGASIEDALTRAKAYTDAGAHGIMIHSKEKSPIEVFAFCKRFREFDSHSPLIVVPTTYNSITEEEFIAHGVNIVIYANHLIRSAFPAMKKTAELILQNSRSLEADDLCMKIEDILTLIPE